MIFFTHAAKLPWAVALVSLMTCSTLWAQGQETLIRKNLTERVPQMPKIEEVTRTAMPGL